MEKGVSTSRVPILIKSQAWKIEESSRLLSQKSTGRLSCPRSWSIHCFYGSEHIFSTLATRHNTSFERWKRWKSQKISRGWIQTSSRTFHNWDDSLLKRDLCGLSKMLQASRHVYVLKYTMIKLYAKTCYPQINSCFQCIPKRLISEIYTTICRNVMSANTGNRLLNKKSASHLQFPLYLNRTLQRSQVFWRRQAIETYSWSQIWSTHQDFQRHQNLETLTQGQDCTFPKRRFSIRGDTYIHCQLKAVTYLA